VTTLVVCSGYRGHPAVADLAEVEQITPTDEHEDLQREHRARPPAFLVLVVSVRCAYEIGVRDAVNDDAAALAGRAAPRTLAEVPEEALLRGSELLGLGHP
jgi:hypothetical protein